MNSLEQSASPEPTTDNAACLRSDSFAVSSESSLPGVFLMTNSFEMGGSERQFVTLARSLDSATFRVNFGCIMRKGAFQAGFDQVPEFAVGRSLYGLRSWKSRVRLARHLRQLRMAVAHSFDFYTNLMLIPAARMAGVPVVIGSQRQLGDLLTPSKFRAQVATFRWADVVICNSRVAASRLAAAGVPERKLAVIRNGISDLFFSGANPALPRQPGILRVGMIARMNTWSKNHRLLLAAAARLNQRHANLEFLLVGNGPLRPELERAAQELGMADRVRFLGEREDVENILASIDISVLPSGSESSSNAILESMAAGVPVVATDAGGNPELAGEDRGILVKSGNELDLERGIERLITDASLRRKLGENARDFVRRNFTVEQMRIRHEELYRELLEKKRWRPRLARVANSQHNRPTRPLRIALVCASLHYVGGQSVQADLLMGHWKNDPAVQVNFIPIDPPLPRLLAWIERIRGLRTVIREPFYIGALWKGFKNADLAHVFSASYWSFLVAPAPAWLIAKLRGKKVLIHYHSGEARDHLRRSRSARYVLKRADRLVVPSGYLVEVFREVGLKADVVPNIIDLSQFSFRLRNPVRPHLVCTRGFHPYYSVNTVVRAFARVRRVFPEARLDLVGSGPQEREIRRLVKDLRVNGVKFTGVASRYVIGRFYDAADIFINASWLDNMPVSILEAFASGTPVISTAPEGIRYLVEHERTGLLSPPGDPEALAANVVRLLRDPRLAVQLALNAQEQCKRYSWNAARQQWLAVYQSIVDSSRLAAQGLANAAGP
jgi:L-malate glycosyltransferase